MLSWVARSREQSRWKNLKICFHASLSVAKSGSDGTVVKVSSKTMWYCGMIRPVAMLRTRGTREECWLEKPRNMPKRARGNHLGMEFPSWRAGSRTYTGHPKTWARVSSFIGEHTWVHNSRGEAPVCMLGMRLKTQTT